MAEQQIELAVSGLQTDPGPFSAAPGGSLIEAQNVAFRRPGVIEPRGPFAYTLDATATTQKPISIFEWQGDVYAILDDGHIRKNTTTDIGHTSFTTGKAWSAIARDRVIFTSDNGSYAVDNGASTIRRTGSPRGSGFLTACGNNGVLAGVNWLATNYSTAYRVVNVKFSGTEQLLGPPSEIRRVRNNSGSPVYVVLTLYIDTSATGMAAGDVIQVYRALKVTPYTSDSADEMRLRTSIVLASGDISAGYVTFTDVLDDGAWSGDSLYTNESQGGPAFANYRPYDSVDVAFYNNMQFYGSARTPHRVSLNAKAIGLPLGGTAPSEWSQTLTSMDVTATISAIGQTTTSLPAAFRTNGAKQGSIAIGQVLTLPISAGGVPGSADAVFQANTKVTAYNPATGQVTWDLGTLSAPGAGTTFTAWDWVGVDYGGGITQTIYAFTGAIGTGAAYNGVWGTADGVSGFPGTGLSGGSCDMERAWAASFPSIVRLYSNETNQGAYLGIQLTFERCQIGPSSFNVKSTKPLAFDRYCDSVTGIDSQQEGNSNTVVWSKYQLPESVPIPYAQQLGPNDNVVQRLAVLKDTLFVFTTHGMYRFFGTDPDSLIIDLFDPTIRLVDPRMLARSHNVLWAWTTRGVMQISPGGAERIDLPIAKDLDDQRVLSSYFASGNWWMTASDALDLVLLGSDTADTSAGLDYAWNGYAFHPKTSCWAWWNGRRAVTAATFATDTSIIPYFGITGGYATNSYLVNVTSAQSQADHTNVVFDVDTTVGTLITLLANATWDVTIGDVIESGDGSFYVVDVTSDLIFTVDRIGFASPHLRVGESCMHRVVWVGNDADDPMIDKSFIKATQPFLGVRHGRTFKFVFSGYQNTTEYSTTSSYDGSGNQTIPQIHLNHVPHEVGRDWALKAGFQQAEAGAYWATSGLRLLTRYTGDKVARG